MADRTVTIKSAAGDYTSMGNLQSGINKDCVSQGGIVTVECYTMDDASMPTLSGWTTDASNKPKFVAMTKSSRAGSGGYRIKTSGFAGIVCQIAHCEWDGICITAKADNNFGQGITFNTATAWGVVFKNGVIAGIQYTAALKVTSGSSGTFAVSNCYFFDWSEQGVFFSSGFSATGSIINCTAYNCASDSFREAFDVEGGTVTAKNNISVYGASRPSFTADYSGGFSGSSTNNLRTDGGSAVGSNPQTGTPTFISTGGDDYGLDAADTAAKDLGADTSGDGVTTDYDGTARPQGSAYDIGAYEIAGGGGGPAALVTRKTLMGVGL